MEDNVDPNKEGSLRPHGFSHQEKLKDYYLKKINYTVRDSIVYPFWTPARALWRTGDTGDFPGEPLGRGHNIERWVVPVRGVVGSL